MADFQPPPTYAEVILVDEKTGKATFNPIWLKWFIDLVAGVGPSGAGSVTSIDMSGGTTGLTTAGGPITTSGTLTLGGILVGANGGTGVANTGKTITLGGNLTTTPANAITFTTTGATNVTLPTSGTLSTTTGTVTSVALALPTSVFDISGSPVTGAGTLTATFDTQAANTAFMGPTSGGAATPAFRALVAADIPVATRGNNYYAAVHG